MGIDGVGVAWLGMGFVLGFGLGLDFACLSLASLTSAWMGCVGKRLASLGWNMQCCALMGFSGVELDLV